MVNANPLNYLTTIDERIVRAFNIVVHDQTLNNCEAVLLVTNL